MALRRRYLSADLKEQYSPHCDLGKRFPEGRAWAKALRQEPALSLMQDDNRGSWN